MADLLSLQQRSLRFLPHPYCHSVGSEAMAQPDSWVSTLTPASALVTESMAQAESFAPAVGSGHIDDSFELLHPFPRMVLRFH